MAKVDLMAGIQSVSGRAGNFVFRTFRRLDGKTETRMYPYKKQERKTKLSQNELASRAKFRQVAARLNALSNEEREQYANEWKQNNYFFNGKKYATLRGYIMTRLYADMKNLPD